MEGGKRTQEEAGSFTVHLFPNKATALVDARTENILRANESPAGLGQLKLGRSPGR